MSSKKHPEFDVEKDRLDYTVNYIEKTLEATDAYKTLYKGNIKQAMTELDHLDSSLSYINVLINTKFMEVAEKNYDSYKKAKGKPYFARIDFKRKGEEKINKLYIGKTSLIRAEDNEMLIVDWRAPIATIYYEGRLGETSYAAEGGLEEGELLLKRQFTVDKGKLHNIIDIDITTTDTFLQASLEANAESKLKDIASTIQGEQNRVIRAPMNKPLIVQGAAGSGKTTIALHRIAYFIYTYEETFDPESFLIIAPNNLFINYISEVLPELGVEKVKQSTFIDFMEALIGKGYRLTNSDEKLMYIIHHSKEESNLLTWASAFKGSMDFKNIIDEYVKEIEQEFAPALDFILQGKVLLPKEEIRRMFLEDLKYHPLHKRADEIKKSLNNKLKSVKKDMLKDIQTFYDKAIDAVREECDDAEERRDKVTALADERDEKLKNATNEMKAIVKKYLDAFPKKNLYEYYEELLTAENIMKFSRKSLNEEKVNYLCDTSKSLLHNKHIELEDLAPLVYLKHKIFGFEKKIDIRSVVIDEAQDFSLFQFFVLKEVLCTNMFTLLGDLSQGIHSYRGTNNWEEVLDKVFGKDDSSYMTLVQSYRTTIEVMKLANEVIKKLNNENIVLAKPVIRHGGKPELRSFEEDKTLIKSLEDKIGDMKTENYKSIAIICKTVEECKNIKKLLDKGGKIHSKILDEKQREYEAGVILVPSHLAKGLEFDVVFIVNVKEAYLEEELDIKLLYVAMTRTLHRLFIYHKEGKLPLLKSISDEYYRYVNL
jgi:DNA helicase II / ATP-dependent DNA helicase PcrA